MKPICFLFLSVTRINPCLKQQRYQKKLQMTHSNEYTSHISNNPLKMTQPLTDRRFTAGGVCDQYLRLTSLFQKLPANKYWSRYITFFVLFFGVLNLSSKNWPQIDIDLTALLFRSDMFVYFFQVMINCV